MTRAAELPDAAAAMADAFDRAANGPRVSEDRALADQVRELIRLCRSSAVDDATQAKALEHLSAATDLLGNAQYEGPYWVTGQTVLQAPTPTRDLQAMCPYSPAMGPANPIAPNIEITVGDDNTVHGLVTLSESYNGPPFDHAHGGVIALLYDDLVGMATMLGAGGGMTANLSIDYRRPTPLFKPLEIVAWFDHAEGRKLHSKGTMHCEGELLSEANGLFIRPDSFPVGTPTP
ncbi:MAG TPA: PaaI family thioesterase [Acidimicrobiales bacterium]|nr:PaaI family thioesterase [Acidimicrobiales bacterium]